MSKRPILLGIFFSVVHLVGSFLLFVVSCGATMEAFDAPNIDPSLFAKVAGVMVDILWQPMVSLWTPWMAKNLPDFIEWVLLIINSALWGFAISLFLHFAVQRIKSKQPI